MRGALVFPKWHVVAPLDTAAIAAAGGYDDDFKIPNRTDADGDGVGEDPREGNEGDEIRFKAQVEHDRDELQQMTPGGNLPDSAVGLVIRKSVMNRLGLITAVRPLGVKVGDRLVRRETRGGAVSKSYDSPKLYCTHAGELDGMDDDNDPAILIFGEWPQGLKR
jgi:hypothetical protein